MVSLPNDKSANPEQLLETHLSGSSGKLLVRQLNEFRVAGAKLRFQIRTFLADAGLPEEEANAFAENEVAEYARDTTGDAQYTSGLTGFKK